jgi:broad specificity phosphatase PhoE
MSLTIYFMRHGETTASRTGGYCGTLDPDLTPVGYQMAEDFADAYRSLPWVATGNVLVVSHKATTRIMLCFLIGIDVGRFRDRISMPVSSISIVEMAAHGPLLHMIGDRAYLREHLRKSVEHIST